MLIIKSIPINFTKISPVKTNLLKTVGPYAIHIYSNIHHPNPETNSKQNRTKNGASCGKLRLESVLLTDLRTATTEE